MPSAIYEILSPSGKRYIGSALDVKRRWNNHRDELRRNCHHSLKLQNAWNKYGERLEFKIIEIITDAVQLVKREQYWMDLYDVYKSGYNMYPIARSSAGIVRSEEFREKIRISMQDPKRRESIRESNRNRIVSQETRELQSLAKLGTTRSEETRLRISHSIKEHWKKRRGKI